MPSNIEPRANEPEIGITTWICQLRQLAAETAEVHDRAAAESDLPPRHRELRAQRSRLPLAIAGALAACWR